MKLKISLTIKNLSTEKMTAVGANGAELEFYIIHERNSLKEGISHE